MEISNYRRAGAALDMQPVGGFAVKLYGGFLVFRDAPLLWRLVKVGTVMNEFECVGRALTVLDAWQRAATTPQHGAEPGAGEGENDNVLRG